MIEVMGLAVLPARLKEELSAVADALAAGRDLRGDELTAKHADWAEAFAKNYTVTADNALDIVKKETGLVFAKVLEHAGVYASHRQYQNEMAFELVVLYKCTYYHEDNRILFHCLCHRLCHMHMLFFLNRYPIR